MKTKGNRRTKTNLTGVNRNRSNKPPPAPPVTTSLTECCFCKSSEDSELGKWYQNEENNLAAHQFCLLFSSGLPQSGNDQDGFEGFLFPDIMKELRRVRRSVCRFCLRFGASSGCFVKSCPFTYHFKCGLENDAQFDFHGTFNTFCFAHRSFQDMSYILNGSNTPTCPICLESVHTGNTHGNVNDNGNGNTQMILKMPCCKNVFAHKSCIQNQANASGYFFLCPTCKNEKGFKREMAKFGIHIPMKDASWEENNAFSDLLQQYKSCDLPTCLCPMGKNYEEDDGKWELIRCYHCGQGAIHRQCLGQRFVSFYGYTCRDCDQVTGLLKGFTFSPQKSKEQSLEHKRLVEEHIAKGDSLHISHLLSSEKFCKVYDVKPCRVEIIRLPKSFLSNWLEISECCSRRLDEKEDDIVTMPNEELHAGTMVAMEVAPNTVSKIKIPKKRKRGRPFGIYRSMRRKRSKIVESESLTVPEVSAILKPSVENQASIKSQATEIREMCSDPSNIEYSIGKANKLAENEPNKINDNVDSVNDDDDLKKQGGKENLITAWISTMLQQSKTSGLPINVEYESGNDSVSTLSKKKKRKHGSAKKSRLSNLKMKSDVMVNNSTQRQKQAKKVDIGSSSSLLKKETQEVASIPNCPLIPKQVDGVDNQQNPCVDVVIRSDEIISCEPSISKRTDNENETSNEKDALNFEAVALQKIVQTKYQSRKKSSSLLKKETQEVASIPNCPLTPKQVDGVDNQQNPRVDVVIPSDEIISCEPSISKRTDNENETSKPISKQTDNENESSKTISKRTDNENESSYEKDALNFEAVALQKIVRSKYQSRKKKKRSGEKRNDHKILTQVTTKIPDSRYHDIANTESNRVKSGQKRNDHKILTEVTTKIPDSGYHDVVNTESNLIQAHSNDISESYTTNDHSLDMRMKQKKLSLKKAEQDLENKFESRNNNNEGECSKSKIDPRSKITFYVAGKVSVEKNSVSNRSKKKKKKGAGCETKNNTFMDSWLKKSQTNSPPGSNSKHFIDGNSSIGLAETHSIGLAETHSIGLAETCSIGLAETHSIGLAENHSIGLAETRSIGLAETRSIGLAETRHETSTVSGTNSNKRCAQIGYDEEGNSVNIKIEDLSDDDLPLLELRKQFRKMNGKRHTRSSGPVIDIT